MSQSKPQVLIVEDDREFLENLMMTLESFGCEVLSAANGQEALAVVEKMKPTAVLCDIQMPIMSGVQFLDVLRAKGIELPVIIMTGFSEHDDNEIFQRGGVVRLQKPITRKQLKEIVEGYINLLHAG